MLPCLETVETNISETNKQRKGMTPAFLLCLAFVVGDRILRLKADNKRYVTNANGSLRLEPPTAANLPNQRVVIHNRTLFFYRDGTYFTLAMGKDSVEIILVVYNALNDRDLGFATAQAPGTRRRIVTPFTYLAKDPSGQKEGRKPKRDPPNPKTHVTRTRAEREKRRIPRPAAPGDEGYESMDEERFLEDGGPAAKRSIRSDGAVEGPLGAHYTSTEATRTSETGTRPRKPKAVETLHVEQSKAVVAHAPGQTHKSHYVESDSKMDSHEFGYLIKNVMVAEMDTEHFRLRTKENVCVTYYKESFVFTPCSFSENQLFKLDAADSVLKQSSAPAGFRSLAHAEQTGTDRHKLRAIEGPGAEQIEERTSPARSLRPAAEHPAAGPPAPKLRLSDLPISKASSLKTSAAVHHAETEDFLTKFKEALNSEGLSDFI
jgi:hypothetical protein